MHLKLAPLRTWQNCGFFVRSFSQRVSSFPLCSSQESAFQALSRSILHAEAVVTLLPFGEKNFSVAAIIAAKNKIYLLRASLLIWRVANLFTPLGWSRRPHKSARGIISAHKHKPRCLRERILREVLYDVSLYFNICRWPPSNKQMSPAPTIKSSSTLILRPRYYALVALHLVEKTKRMKQKLLHSIFFSKATDFVDFGVQ